MNFPQKIGNVALGLILLVSSLATANESTPTQSENTETKKLGEVSFGFKAGFIYGCLERQKYDPQRNEETQNMGIVAFCLCFLEEILPIAVVEGAHVILPTDTFAIQEKCIHKVKTEVFTE
jgi:hypothetical protein